jgi:YcxB-like protein
VPQTAGSVRHVAFPKESVQLAGTIATVSESESVRISFQSSPAERRRGYLDYQVAHPRRFLTNAALNAIIMAGLLRLAVHSTWLVSVVAGATLGLALSVCGDEMTFRRSQKNVEVFATLTYEFSEAGIAYTSSIGSGSLDWSAFANHRSTAHFCYLDLRSQRSFLLLPKRAFASLEDLQHFEALASARVGAEPSGAKPS